MRLLPIEAHYASHLIRIGCLTPDIVRTLSKTLARAPLDKTEEYSKCLDTVGFKEVDDPWANIKWFEGLKKPTANFGDETRWLEPAINYMVAKGMYINLFGGWNIIYIEGATISGNKLIINDDRIDHWNDLRIIARVVDGLWQGMAFPATTEPGRHYTQNPMSPKGAARIAFGQHRSWRDGKHQNQDAIVQCAPVLLHRDLNKDGSRVSDELELCVSCGINQHTTTNDPLLVGKWSAGCLVGRFVEHHKKFLREIRKDYRIHKGYKYLTTVLNPHSF